MRQVGELINAGVRGVSALFSFTAGWESYVRFCRRVSRSSRPRKRSICRTYQGYAARPRIMVEKTWLTAKLRRGLSWDCVDSRLRTINAFPSPSSTRRLCVFVIAHATSLYVRGYVNASADSESEKSEREREGGQRGHVDPLSHVRTRERCGRNRSVRYAAICIHIGSL